MLHVPDTNYDVERAASPSPSSLKSFKAGSTTDASVSLRRPSRIYTSLSNVRCRCDTAFGSISNASRRLTVAVIPPAESTPDRLTVVMSLLCFGTYIVFCALAVRFPNYMMQVSFLAYGAAMFLGLLARVASDYSEAGKLNVTLKGAAMLIYHTGQAPYSRNTGNTVLTILMTFAVLTPLYAKVWYPALNAWVIQIQSESVDQVRMPAVAILQDDGQGSAAHLSSQPWTCWVGSEHNATAPACDTMSVDQISANDFNSCNCSSYFDREVHPTDTNNSPRHILFFAPSGNIVASSPSTFLNLEIAFTYNTSTYSGSIGSPGLWLSLYDPNLSQSQALNTSLTSLTPFNANGVTTVLLNANYWHRRNEPAHYAYDPIISTEPYLNLACDTANGTDGVKPCSATLRMRFAGLQQSTYTEHTKMTWSDAAESAGSYFALVTFLSWVFSGLAWTAFS